MGKAPDVIIVVRHGARLDAADDQWHLTSPTPYDPPLTYGGWNQSKDLGARIASILRSRESHEGSDAASASTTEEQKPRRRHKVVIHTSPFLRCIQTSIAISAGLAQQPGAHESKNAAGRASSVPYIKSPNAIPSKPSPLHSPRLDALSEKRPTLATKNQSESFTPSKPTLKIDAFLGEWLSPDYFQDITPPPASTMMVAGAKGDLLRRIDTDKLIRPNDLSPQSPVASLPGMWGSPSLQPLTDQSDSDTAPLTTLSSMSQALPAPPPPRRDRTSSMSSASSGASGRSSHKSVKFSPIQKAESTGPYIAPTPSYSVYATDPIPPGYVVHARDRCANIDFQWDSSRAPQKWGDGGAYGEEWSSMHKRFRKGLQELVNWYTNHTMYNPATTKWLSNDRDAVKEPIVEEEEEDLVVILVSHAAGCNALIGALTNQPALIDIGTASLTMATRRTQPLTLQEAQPVPPTTSNTPHGLRMTVSEDYEMKLLVSTDHLRVPLRLNHNINRSASTAQGSFRERYTPGIGVKQKDGMKVGDTTVELRDTSNSTSTNFGSIRRFPSVASQSRHTQPQQKLPPSVGLWNAPSTSTIPSPPTKTIEEAEGPVVLTFNAKGTQAEDVDEDDIAPDDTSTVGSLDGKLERIESRKSADTHEEDKEDKEDTIAPFTGLWGASRPPGKAERIRDTHVPKRRWTITQRGI